MREILFKAKRLDNGEWVEGFYVYKKYFRITKGGVPKYEGYKHFIYNDMYGFVMIDVNTLCQYTGLTDKNGNKIWEHDVVQEDFGEFKGVVAFGEFESNVLKNIGFSIDWSNEKVYYRQDFAYWVDKIEVIGNIFDNPELLKGE